MKYCAVLFQDETRVFTIDEIDGMFEDNSLSNVQIEPLDSETYEEAVIEAYKLESHGIFGYHLHK